MTVPVLETARLRLRPWRDDDIEPWVAMGADPQVMRFFPALTTREQAEAQAVRMREALERDGYGWWILEERAGAAMAGVIALQRVPFDAPFTPALEVGWRLRPAFWGRGYATEGARAAVDHAFGVLGSDEVVAMTSRVNRPSQRVMERLGMTHDPADDFEHPLVAEGHPIRPHVLYRLASPARNARISAASRSTSALPKP